MKWELHTDGSFDLVADGIAVRGAYPAVDGVPLRCLTVEVAPDSGGGTVRYRLPDAEWMLRFGRTDDTLTLDTELAACAVAPHWVAPLAGGRVVGADRFFRQGVGIGGPSMFVNLNEPGTGPVDSYTISAIVSADDRTVTAAALDQRRFAQRTTLRTVGPEAGVPGLDVAFRTERIPLPDARLELPRLHFRTGVQPWDTLRATARAIGAEMHARTHHPTSYHWCSWYYLYHNLTETLLDEYLDGFSKLEPPVPLQTIQIDAGYFPAAGDWLLTTPYWPSGMQAAMQKIASAGYRPGIWIAPFMVGNRSQLYAEHPDWVLHDTADQPVAPWKRYNEPKPWGYRDEQTFVLDTSHPEAMNYVRHVFATFRQWGATFFKTDFMLWGFQDSTGVRRHTPGKTSVEYFRDVLAVIRDAIGEESFWLACISPYAPFLGYADAMRIGGDVGAEWAKEGFGPWNMLRETQGTQHFNNVWWQNDPDAILLRDFHIWLNATEIRSLAMWQTMMGGVINTSAPLHEIAPDRLALWRFLEPGPEHWTTQLPCFGRPRKLLVAVREFPSLAAWAVLAFNPDDEPHTETIELADALGLPDAHVYRWGPGRCEPLGKCSRLVPELGPHAAELYYVARDDTPPPADLTLGGRE